MMIWIDTEGMDEFVTIHQKTFHIMKAEMNFSCSDIITKDICEKRERVYEISEYRKCEIMKLLEYLSEKYYENEQRIISENAEEYIENIK